MHIKGPRRRQLKRFYHDMVEKTERSFSVGKPSPPSSYRDEEGVFECLFSPSCYFSLRSGDYSGTLSSSFAVTASS